MANTILHKRSSVNNAVPSAGSLSDGEIAINTRNAKMFIKNTADIVVEFCALNDGIRGDITLTSNASIFTVNNADFGPIATSQSQSND